MSMFQFVTGLHGNEYLPCLALASLGIPQVLGNPRALAQGKRFIDADLNGVFGMDGQGYEHQRARELQKLLNPHLPVIDFHTFSTKSEPFVIVVDLDMVPLAQKTGIERIVYMKKNCKEGHALINHLPGISIEVGEHTSPNAFALTQKVVRSLAQEKHTTKTRHTVYEVYDLITEKGEYQNFQKHKDGFYPILSGKNPYNFFGLKARLLSRTS